MIGQDIAYFSGNHKLGYKLLLSDILPQFEDIKNRIGVTDEVFIEHLAEWNTDLDKYITKNQSFNYILETIRERIQTLSSRSNIHQNLFAKFSQVIWQGFDFSQ